MADPRVVILNDVDIYARGDVEKIVNVIEEKTFARDKLVNSQFSITVKNYDNFYSVDNNTSYFKNTNWRYGDLKIYNPDGDLIWDGMIRRIERLHKSGLARIVTISKLHKKFNEKITYTSSSAETPASAAKNIMDNYDVSYDAATIQNSINTLDAAGCYIKANFTADDGITIMAAIEKLSEYACADAFSSVGKVYFKHWTQFAGGVKVNLIDKDLKTSPNVSDTETELINQFSISYDGDEGVPITDTNNIGAISRQDSYFGAHNLPGMSDAGEDAQIYFTTKAGAQYIGESYIKRTHINVNTQPRPPWKIDFSLKGTSADWLDLQTYITLTLSAESWSQKVFEIFKTEINYNDNSIKLLAIEAQT